MQPLYILQGLICLNILFQLIIISFFNRKKKHWIAITQNEFKRCCFSSCLDRTICYRTCQFSSSAYIHYSMCFNSYILEDA